MKLTRQRKRAEDYFTVLPLELVAYILDHVKDIYTLERLRLVSRFFSDRVRQLTRKVYIPIYPELGKDVLSNITNVLNMYTNVRELETQYYIERYPSSLRSLRIHRSVQERIVGPHTPQTISLKTRNLTNLDELYVHVMDSIGEKIIETLAPLAKTTLSLNTKNQEIGCSSTLTNLTIYGGGNCLCIPNYSTLRYLCMGYGSSKTTFITNVKGEFGVFTNMNRLELHDSSNITAMKAMIRMCSNLKELYIRRLTIELAIVLPTVIPKSLQLLVVEQDMTMDEMLSLISECNKLYPTLRIVCNNERRRRYKRK